MSDCDVAKMDELMSQPYEALTNCTLAQLQAMADADLNALAAELRGWHLEDDMPPPELSTRKIQVYMEGERCFTGYAPRGLGGYVTKWSPTLDRNQSGALLEWLADKGFSVSIGRDQTGVTSVGISHSDYGRFGAHDEIWPRAETIAFCAAMLAMAGRLQ